MTENVWMSTMVSLGKHGDSVKSRPGFVNQDGLIALPPKAAKSQKPWFDRMGIKEDAINVFLKM
jgi:hypothetical protein